MKNVLLIPGVVLLMAGCEQEPVPMSPPSENPSPACDDPSFLVGSQPATSASFDIDCTFVTRTADGTPGVGMLYDCKTLSMGITFADGTEQTYSLTSSDTYAASTYEPGGQASTQFALQLSTRSTPFADGWSPVFFIDVPVSLARSGTFPLGSAYLNGDCWEQSKCVGLLVGAGKENADTYSLGEIDSGQVTIDAIGLGNGSQVKLHATGVKLVAQQANPSQATCADGKIHHRP